MTTQTLTGRPPSTAPDLLTALNPNGTASERRKPRNTNKGKRFPPDPPTVEEIVQVLNACVPLTNGTEGRLSALRLRALIITLWRTGIRCSEALALEERDLIPNDNALLIRRGKGGKQRIVVMDEWGWRELRTWMHERAQLPPGPIFCLVRSTHAGEPLSDTDVRRQLRDAGQRAGLRKRFHAHALRHRFAIESRREGIDYLSLQRQLGHARLDVTAAYLSSIDPMEVLAPFAQRRPPMMIVPSSTETCR